MTETFRLRKSVKYLGMALTAIYLAALIGVSSIFFLEEPAKHGFKGEHSVAGVGGMGLAFFGTMLLMSIYMWRAYYVECFTIRGTMISIRSMLQNRQFDVSELERLSWRIRPVGGSILFRLLGSKARLDLGGYNKSDRLRIIRSLNDLVPSRLQEDWPQFCHKIALPLRDGKPSTMVTEPSARFCTVTRKRYDRMFMLAFPLSLALAFVFWLWLNLLQLVSLPVLVIVAWLLLRFNVPPEGRAETRLTSTHHGRAQLILWTVYPSGVCLLLLLGLLGMAKSTASAIVAMFFLAAFLPALYLLKKAVRLQQTADLQAAQLAPAKWQQGETAHRATD